MYMRRLYAFFIFWFDDNNAASAFFVLFALCFGFFVCFCITKFGIFTYAHTAIEKQTKNKKQTANKQKKQKKMIRFR